MININHFDGQKVQKCKWVLFCYNLSHLVYISTLKHEEFNTNTFWRYFIRELFHEIFWSRLRWADRQLSPSCFVYKFVTPKFDAVLVRFQRNLRFRIEFLQFCAKSESRDMTEISEDLFFLKWNDYTSEMMNSFHNLRSSEQFTDVTIACENRNMTRANGFKRFRLFKAHRILLCVSSPYFREMLADNPSTHPIIMIREAQAEEIDGILKFIYTGQVRKVNFENRLFRNTMNVSSFALRANSGLPQTTAEMQWAIAFLPR